MARNPKVSVRRPRRPKRISRDEWINRAADYLLENGVATFSVRQLAVQHRVTTQALINHFGSRDALVRQALKRATRRDYRTMERLLGEMTSVRDFFQQFHRELRRREFRRMFAVQVELFATASLDHHGHGDFAVAATRRMHEIFQAQVRREGVPEARVEDVSSALVAFGRGMVLESLGERTPQQLQALVDVILEWYERQLGAKA